MNGRFSLRASYCGRNSVVRYLPLSLNLCCWFVIKQSGLTGFPSAEVYRVQKPVSSAGPTPVLDIFANITDVSVRSVVLS